MDARPSQGPADSTERLRNLDREITRKQNAKSTPADEAAQLGDLDAEIASKQSEIRAAKAALRDARRQSRLEAGNRAGQETDAEAAATERVAPQDLDAEIAVRQNELRTATDAREQLLEAVSVPPPGMQPEAPDDQGAATLPAARERPSRAALRRRIAVASVFVCVMIASGALVGALTDDGAGAVSAPERPGSDAIEYRATLNREIETLATKRGVALEKLREADSPADQAATCIELAAAHGVAARSLEDASIPPGLQAARDSVVSALRRVGSAYGSLASSASRGDLAEYDAGRKAIGQAETALKRSLRASGAQTP